MNTKHSSAAPVTDTRPLKSGSLFSGIGGFDLGFAQTGIEPAWQCEIDNKARSVLARRFPDVPCYEDVRNVKRDNVSAVDLICGGFPCQDLSVAGKRAGLAGERSGLWFEFHRVIAELRPKWVVVENVPGLLSSNGGADFAIILRGLVECGYGVAWRILDAQYFGVAQRRRRVFIVGSLGDGRAAEVLFEREGLFGHPPARQTQGQSVAATIGAQPPSRRNGGSDPTTGTTITGTLAAGAHPGSYNGNDAERGNLIVDTLTAPGANGGRRDKMIVSFDWQAAGSERTSIVDEPGATSGLSSSKTLAVAYNIQQNDGGQHKRKDRPDGGMYVSETDTALTVGSTDQTVLAFGGNNTSGAISIAPAVNAHGGSGRMDFESETFVFEPRYARNGRGAPDTIAPPLKAQNGGTGKGDGAPVVAFNQNSYAQDAQEMISGKIAADHLQAVAISSGVRRLTPTECERLQGFPDGWTDGQSDSARYRQLGNAVAVPVIRWIGERIVRSERETE